MEKNKSKEEKIYKRHKRLWCFLRHSVGPILLSKYGCKSEIAKNLPEPYLVLPNHSTNLDPAWVGMSFPHQMYFVASEHLYRLGWISKVVEYVFAPIAKIKGASDKATVMKMLRYLRDGKNVCLFPDGNCTFNGRTGEITNAIGKLVKLSGANLVTYKLTGGYFTHPRWAFSTRKGKMHGSVVNIYTKEQLAAMSPDEITEVIRKDIDENAYSRQKAEHIRFKGNSRAVGMECAMCVCPKCNQIDVIKTEKNDVICENCGKLCSYDEYGSLVERSDGFIFETIEEWDYFQDDFYKKLVANYKETKSAGEIYFSNDNVTLFKVGTGHESEEVGKGTISISSDSVRFKTSDKEINVKISEIPDMAMYGKTNLVFSDAEGTHYELKSEKTSKKEKVLNVRKYISIWENLRENK